MRHFRQVPTSIYSGYLVGLSEVERFRRTSRRTLAASYMFPGTSATSCDRWVVRRWRFGGDGTLGVDFHKDRRHVRGTQVRFFPSDTSVERSVTRGWPNARILDAGAPGVCYNLANYIVEINQCEGPQISREHLLGHQSLEGGWCPLQPKWHHLKLEEGAVRC
jgi:hypothetical protein